MSAPTRAAPTVLVRGVAVPGLFYGTAWKEDRTESLVTHALEAGFRAIDTANQRRHYFEEGVGAAIAPFIADGRRDELFLQTKFTFRPGQDHRLPYDPAASTGEQVRQSFASSLDHLGVGRIDSLVLHGPSQREGIARADTDAWRAMEELADTEQLTLLGVSNVTAAQLQALHVQARIKPAFVQNRCYANRSWDGEIRAFCEDNDIVYQGFSLLTANRDLWDHPTVSEIAAAHSTTPANILFRTALSLGILPLTGTSNPSRMAAAFDMFNDTLPDSDVQRVLAL